MRTGQKTRTAKGIASALCRSLVDRKRLAFLLVLLAAAVTLTAIPARSGAAPARYVFEKCDSVLPGGGVDGIVYGPHPRGLFSSENTCGQPGGALILRQNEIKEGDGGEADWAVPVSPPVGGTLESVTITAAACGAPEASIWSLGWISPPTSWPGPNCAEDVRSFRLVNEFEAFFIDLKCVNWSSLESKCPAGPWVLAHYFATTVVDPISPTLPEVQGTIFGGGIRRGRQSVSVKAHDTGGGLSSVWLSVNGLSAARPRVATCNVAYADNPSVKGAVAAQVSPCPPELSADWTVDTGAFPFHDGTNKVMVCASDFATLGDPNTSCSPAQAVLVDDSCAESPVGGGDELSAQFEQSKADTVTVGFGKSAAVSGELDTNAGDPVPGATLCVKMGTLGIDQQASPAGIVKTDANGRFSYQVPPGPDREVVIGYRDDANQIARKVRYYAHAKPSLAARPGKLDNGDRVRFMGQLPGPSNGGRVVILQANVVGSQRWITFRKATTGERGGFHGSYHFSSTTQATTYRFRAVVPNQTGYPWVEGASKPVKVKVTG